jgi:hypothetical protein
MSPARFPEEGISPIVLVQRMQVGKRTLRHSAVIVLCCNCYTAAVLYISSRVKILYMKFIKLLPKKSRSSAWYPIPFVLVLPVEVHGFLCWHTRKCFLFKFAGSAFPLIQPGRRVPEVSQHTQQVPHAVDHYRRLQSLLIIPIQSGSWF